MSRLTLKVSPFTAGLSLGLLAALVQAYFKVGPPIAYGVCMVCHPSSMVNWVAAKLLQTQFLSDGARVPMLTGIGVLIGAALAAYRNGELKLRPARQSLFYVVTGSLTAVFGLMLAACPIRAVLLAAYGSMEGIVATLSIVAGVVLATVVMRWSARRAVQRRLVA